MTGLTELIEESPKILAECAIAERLRRLAGIQLHPTLFNTPLIYGPEAAKASMTGLYQEYLETARRASLPLLLTAPTWRLDQTRIRETDVPETINTDAVNYLLELREKNRSESPVLIGALTGPRNDCYRPDLAPTTEAAQAFHTPQIEELAASGTDFLLAQTLPAVGEALGVAQAMAATGRPYIISFCTGPDGRILDGTSLPDAMEMIDQQASSAPIGYFINCTHPRFITSAYPVGSLTRLIGIQANASSKDVTELDTSSATVADPVEDWARSMFELHSTHNVPILGGCCGTSLTHMEHLCGSGYCNTDAD